MLRPHADQYAKCRSICVLGSTCVILKGGCCCRSLPHTLTHMRVRTHTRIPRTLTRAHARARTHAHTHEHTRMRVHARTHTNTHTHTGCHATDVPGTGLCVPLPLRCSSRFSPTAAFYICPLGTLTHSVGFLAVYGWLKFQQTSRRDAILRVHVNI